MQPGAAFAIELHELAGCVTLHSSKYMDKQYKKLGLLVGIVVVAIMGLVALRQLQSGDQSDTANKLRVAATFYPLYEFARQVGGDKVAVTTVTPAGSEPHDFEPSPRDVANLQKTAVLIYNGGTMEPWVERFLADYPHQAIKASSGIDLIRTNEDPEHAAAGSLDPHFWLDPVLAQRIVATIRDGLSAADPANRQYYSAQAAAYSAKLSELDEQMRRSLATCKTRTIITSHQAFTYLAKRYTIDIVPIAGLNPDAEPTAKQLAELSDLIKAKGIKYVFFETLASPKLAETLARETGARTAVFDPIEGLNDEQQKQAKDYLSIQRDNLAALKTALDCQ